MVVKNPVSANLEHFVEAHPCEDSWALKALLEKGNSAFKPPEILVITCMRNAIFVLASKQVYWFKPNRFKEANN